MLHSWVLTNRKEEKRKGKVQLIDATSLKSPLRKNLGNKNCELTEDIRNQILQLYLNFENNEYSKIFNNEEFGYWKITVERPLRLKVDLSHEKLVSFMKAAEDSKDLPAYKLMNKLYEEYKNEVFYNYNEFSLLKKTAKKHNEKLPDKGLNLFEITLQLKMKKRVVKVYKNEKADELYGKFQFDGDIVEFEPDRNYLIQNDSIKLLWGIEQFFRMRSCLMLLTLG